MKFLSITRILCIACLAATVSCAAKQAMQPLAPSTRATVEKSLNHWMTQQNAYQSLSSYAQVSVDARGRRESFDAAILLKSPDKAAIHILDDLGRERFRLIADGRQVSWFNHEDGSYSQVPQQGAALEKALKLPISVEEFIARLLAHIPEGAVIGVQSPDKQIQDAWQIIREEDEITLLRAPLFLESFTAKKKKKMRYQVRYFDFQRYNDLPFPKTVVWNFRKPRAQVEIHFRDIEINPSIAAEKFIAAPFDGDF